MRTYGRHYYHPTPEVRWERGYIAGFRDALLRRPPRPNASEAYLTGFMNRLDDEWRQKEKEEKKEDADEASRR